jgi:hypothetical protein
MQNPGINLSGLARYPDSSKVASPFTLEWDVRSSPKFHCGNSIRNFSVFIAGGIVHPNHGDCKQNSCMNSCVFAAEMRKGFLLLVEGLTASADQLHPGLAGFAEPLLKKDLDIAVSAHLNHQIQQLM